MKLKTKKRIFHYIEFILISLLIITCKKETSNNPNNPPEIPELLSPANNSSLGFSDTLRWSCTDPDGDDLLFDVYLGTTTTPKLYYDNLEDTILAISGLKKDSTYYWYILAVDIYGSSTKSATRNFKAIYDLPTLTTSNVEDITLESAICGGSIISDAGFEITSKGVCWSTNHNPTIADNKTTNGTGNESFVDEISGLSNSTIYYVRAYATTEGGTSYGEEKQFRTYSSTVSDIDGNNYYTIIIGTQEWMVENLKVTKYRNGDPIPVVSENSEWEALTAGAYSSYVNSIINSTIYGNLYNWYVIADNRNIAPVGWHIPGYEEWTTLKTFLGGELVAGGKLKEAGTTHWQNPNTGATNETGFTALPGGYRHIDGSFSNNLSYMGVWWSASENSLNDAYALFISFDGGELHGEPDDMNLGFSIRCVKDQ